MAAASLLVAPPRQYFTNPMLAKTAPAAAETHPTNWRKDTSEHMSPTTEQVRPAEAYRLPDAR